MKYVIFLLSILIGVGLEAQEGKQFTVELSTPGKRGQLKIKNQKGTVEVKGTNRKDILIRYNSAESTEITFTPAENGLTKISGGQPGFDVIERENEVLIESGFMDGGVNFYVEAPMDFDLNVQAFMKGEVKVENVKGEVVIENFDGGIKALGISGHVIANTYNGPINVTFDQINTDTPMAFTTYHGEIDLTFPSNLKATFKVKTDHGDFYTGFEMDVAQEELKQENKEGKWSRTFLGGWINANVNGGGPEIKVKTYHGDIFIRNKG